MMVRRGSHSTRRMIVCPSMWPRSPGGKTLAQDKPPFPNINYLGMRYDLVKANPQPTQKGVFDPGFEGGKSVVDMSDFS
jgi:hypothetical protein